MGSESIAHEAEGRMGYWLRDHEGERNNCFSKIQLVGQTYRDKTTLAGFTIVRLRFWSLSVDFFPWNKWNKPQTPNEKHFSQYDED